MRLETRRRSVNRRVLTFAASSPVAIAGPQHYGDERTVRGNRQGLRPAVLRDVRWPVAKAEPHKHVQCKVRATPGAGRFAAGSVTRIPRDFPARLTDITFSRRRHPSWRSRACKYRALSKSWKSWLWVKFSSAGPKSVCGYGTIISIFNPYIFLLGLSKDALAVSFLLAVDHWSVKSQLVGFKKSLYVQGHILFVKDDNPCSVVFIISV